ncbi:carbohydrate ABC transporter permease [bacterium]|nr:carbohydrate ABC transporter permease [bacterium]
MLAYLLGEASPTLLRNTVAIAVAGLVGTLISSVAVAYAFARFPLPGKNLMLIILIGTIILPSQARLMPRYAFFNTIGWTGTWLPLIVSHVFANAYNVFLLRQYFMTLPRDVDEAAMIDGANPLQIFVRVVLPVAGPALAAAAIICFAFAWNEYLFASIIAPNKAKPYTFLVASTSTVRGIHFGFVATRLLIAIALPVILSLFVQRYIVRGLTLGAVKG